MSIYYQHFSIPFLTAFCVFANLCTVSTTSAHTMEKQATMQAAILVQPTIQPTQFQTDKIQPGQSVKISLLAENIGDTASPASKIFVRFALAKPLDNEPSSILFETEAKELPVIQPGNSLEIAFEKTHKWPSISDFIREDWGMREYQAVIQVEGQQEIIGSLAVTFSAYYYPGIRKELPFTFTLPSAN